MSVNCQCIVLELVPLRGKKIVRLRPQNRIVPSRGSFQHNINCEIGFKQLSPLCRYIKLFPLASV